MDGVDLDAGPRDQPRDERVRVPHLPGPDLVAAPRGCRRLWYESEEPFGDDDVVRQPLRAGDRFVNAGDDAVAPTAHFVAEKAEGAREARPHRALGDDAALGLVAARNRPGLLDHELARGDGHDQRRVVEVAPRPLRAPGDERFVDATVRPHEVAAGAERQPVQIDSSWQRRGHHLLFFGSAVDVAIPAGRRHRGYAPS
jgi:hypothetical protein